MMDYAVDRCTRHCATTGKEFAEGEAFYSALVGRGADVQRHDYAVDAWKGPPEGALGWWKSRMPTRAAKKSKLAPGEVLLGLFDELEHDTEKPDMRYVLALLLVRRRLLRLEETVVDEQGGEVLVLYCPRQDTTHRVAAVMPSDERTAEIQEELARLLFADAE